MNKQQKCDSGQWEQKRYEHGIVWVPCRMGTIVPTRFITCVGKKMKKVMGTMCNVCGHRYS